MFLDQAWPVREMSTIHDVATSTRTATLGRTMTGFVALRH
jgi:hypothetical protein